MKSVYVPFRILSFMTLALWGLTSCQKTDKAPPKIDSNMEAVLVSATNAALGANAEAADLDQEPEASCKVTTFKPSKDVYPHRKIVDFGDGCTGSDGITRSGRRVTTYFINPDLAKEGDFVSETRYSNFTMDGNRVTGFIRIYAAAVGAHGIKTEKVVAYKRLTAPDGSVKSWNGIHFQKQVWGYNTNDNDDDIFEVTGHSEGNQKTPDGIAVRWVSKNSPLHPLIKSTSCSETVAGIKNVLLEFTAGGTGRFLETLDFGDGTCNNTARFSVNGGEPVEITLPLYYWPTSR